MSANGKAGQGKPTARPSTASVSASGKDDRPKSAAVAADPEATSTAPSPTGGDAIATPAAAKTAAAKSAAAKTAATDDAVPPVTPASASTAQGAAAQETALESGPLAAGVDAASGASASGASASGAAAPAPKPKPLTTTDAGAAASAAKTAAAPPVRKAATEAPAAAATVAKAAPEQDSPPAPAKTPVASSPPPSKTPEAVDSAAKPEADSAAKPATTAAAAQPAAVAAPLATPRPASTQTEAPAPSTAVSSPAPTAVTDYAAPPLPAVPTTPPVHHRRRRPQPPRQLRRRPPNRRPRQPALAAEPAAKPAPATKPAPAPEAKPKPAPVPVSRDRLAPEGHVHGIVTAMHRDPFAFLGMHVLEPEGAVVIRCFAPEAKAVTLIDAERGQPLIVLDRVHEDGVFAGSVPGRSAPFAYRLKVETALQTTEIDDPYRFPPVLAEADVLLLAEGNHLTSYEVLGAHVRTVDGVTGVAFAVWAPNAGRVAVIGDFNTWDGRCHGMRLRHDCGVWEIFLPGVAPGQMYKYEIRSSSGVRLPDKCDPYAFLVETPPGSAAIVCELDAYPWADQAWMRDRAAKPARETPISIYEVHLPSWRRNPEEGHRPLTYRELAQDLVSYVAYMQFTHIQLLPVADFDDDASLGFQTYAPFAPSHRWGEPDDLRMLIDAAHQAGIGVILNWVPTQFTDDPHSLREFDGTHLYEPADSRMHLPGSSLLTYDYSRREVVNYLISNAIYWFETFHVDALHIDGVSRMLYLDYGRSRGDWQPNRFGGHEYLEAMDFLRRFNSDVYSHVPGIFTICEENSQWPQVSHPAFVGGLGFGFKWHTGWARELLHHLSRNPVHRKYYFDEVIQGPRTVFSENHVLSLSHELVSYGQGSLLRRMPGDTWQRFANLRLFYAYLYTHPGKKLMFMGDEFAQEREWNSDISLDWHLAGGDGVHQGVQRLVRDLNTLYRSTPALYEQDCEADGFAWIDCTDSDQGVLAFQRTGANGKGLAIVLCHFTPVVRKGYRVGVPQPGFYAERLNTDAERYGGTNSGNAGGAYAEAEPAHGQPYSVSLVLPPFAAVILEHTGANAPD